jgi:thiol:disulfide interchange protein DsbD
LVTSLLALLFFAIGLNLLGVFHVGGSVQNAGAGAAARGGDAGAFFTGALAVVAATPCTAPFMAGAIGAALTQSNAATLAIFVALGAGFALPVTAIHFLPGLQRALPKPGAWMERVRNVLAFPMFAAAAWLAWVLTQQAGANGVLALLLLSAALGFALVVAQWGRVWLIAGLIVLALAATFAWRPLTTSAAPAAVRADAWSAARVAQLRAEGRAVFVNFTAAWCITCQANELNVLSRPDVAEAFARNGVVYLKADWTNQDAAIAAELAAHGRAGVPLYLYYPRGDAQPIVLPQNLSEQAINEAIAGVR